MKNPRIALAGLALLALALPLAAQSAPPAPAAAAVARPSILILGTIHFGGSTADLFSQTCGWWIRWGTCREGGPPVAFSTGRPTRTSTDGQGRARTRRTETWGFF
jgi:hypothetical protein